jgi:hypothetical protein
MGYRDLPVFLSYNMKIISIAMEWEKFILPVLQSTS